MSFSLSPLQESVIAVLSIVTLLVLIELYVSQASWLFAISVLVAWPLADKLYKGVIEFFDIQQSQRPVGFIIYALAIIGASVVASTVSQQMLLPFNLPTSENLTTTENVTRFLGGNITLSPPTVISRNPPVPLATVVLVSAVVSLVNYVFTNYSQLKVMVDEYREYS